LVEVFSCRLPPTPNQKSSDDYFGGRLPPTPKWEICAAQIREPTPTDSQKKPQGVPDLPDDSQCPPKKDEEKKEERETHLDVPLRRKLIWLNKKL
jgi:hypothetical protein